MTDSMTHKKNLIPRFEKPITDEQRALYGQIQDLRIAPIRDAFGFLPVNSCSNPTPHTINMGFKLYRLRSLIRKPNDCVDHWGLLNHCRCYCTFVRLPFVPGRYDDEEVVIR
jgi:hypothetical protein